MKKLIILVSLCLLGIPMVIGQVTVTTSSGLYEEPSINSKRIATAFEGQTVVLGEKSGEFWKVTIQKKTGYIHETCLSNFSKPTTKAAEEPVTIPTSPVKPIPLTPDSIKFEDYGGPWSIGFALGGGGLIGMPVRFFLHRNFAIELGAYVRGLIVDATFFPGLNVTGGINYYTKSSYNQIKQKIRHDGLFLRGGTSLYSAEIKEFMVMAGWTRDHFAAAVNNHAFTLDLGVGLLNSTYTKRESGTWGTSISHIKSNTPMLYWKFSWGIFPKKK